MSVQHLTGSSLPSTLQHIPDPPKSLYVRGELAPLLARPRLSVVGSRKPSTYGRQVTEQLVHELASHGIVIISGLALGIDSIAHRACLAVGGQTIAVLPNSVDTIYPRSHHQLAHDILTQGGALISEYAENQEAYKYNFIARNRLVSGLADGLLIIEAAAGSGTLHTANFALDQSRPVMVVPGNITSPLSDGTNHLLASLQATPILDTNDILTVLGLTRTQVLTEVLAANAEEAIILKLLQQGISDASRLQSLSTLDPSHFNQTLTMLEITGKIYPLGAGHWAMK